MSLLRYIVLPCPTTRSSTLPRIPLIEHPCTSASIDDGERAGRGAILLPLPQLAAVHARPRHATHRHLLRLRRHLALACRAHPVMHQPLAPKLELTPNHKLRRLISSSLASLTPGSAVNEEVVVMRPVSRDELASLLYRRCSGSQSRSWSTSCHNTTT